MRNLLAPIILLACWSTSWAADREQFTLKDGRVIVGTYDDTTSTLSMESPKAALHVDAREIVKREAAPAPKVPAKPIAAREREPAPADTPSVAPAGLADALAALKASHEQQERAAAESEKAAAMRKQYEAARDRMLFAYFKDADLLPVAVHLPSIPTDADLRAAQDVKQFNDDLHILNENRKTAAINGHPEWTMFSNLNRDTFLRRYAELKSAQWINSLLEPDAGRR